MAYAASQAINAKKIYQKKPKKSTSQLLLEMLHDNALVLSEMLRASCDILTNEIGSLESNKGVVDALGLNKLAEEYI